MTKDPKERDDRTYFVLHKPPFGMDAANAAEESASTGAQEEAPEAGETGAAAASAGAAAVEAPGQADPASVQDEAPPISEAAAAEAVDAAMAVAEAAEAMARPPAPPPEDPAPTRGPAFVWSSQDVHVEIDASAATARKLDPQPTPIKPARRVKRRARDQVGASEPNVEAQSEAEPPAEGPQVVAGPEAEAAPAPAIEAPAASQEPAVPTVPLPVTVGNAAVARTASGAQVLTASVELPKDYVPTAESAHQLYQIDTEAFAGPLDLLVFLIRRHDIDIFNIPIAFICERYLEALEAFEDLSLDVASEFMYMASELLHIKSRMLLPKPETTEEEEEGDPRAELVRRLLEYQKYQEAAMQIGDLDRLGRDVFTRQPGALPAAGPAQLREVNIFALVHAFNAVLKRQKPEVVHRVVVEQVSVKKRMTLLVDVLCGPESTLFLTLLNDLRDRLDVVVTFLAVLELTRLKLLRVLETDAGDLLLTLRFEAPEQALQRLSGVDDQFAG